MKRLAATLLLLAGGSGTPEVKVVGIEGLKTTEDHLSLPETVSICAARMGIPVILAVLVTPIACATVNLEAWTCDLFYAMEGVSLDHERRHCFGEWHDD